jgi:hypothetical protein
MMVAAESATLRNRTRTMVKIVCWMLALEDK